MRGDEKTRSVNIRLPVSLFQKLEKASKGEAVAVVIRGMIRDALSKMK